VAAQVRHGAGPGWQDATAQLLERCLVEAVRRWAPDDSVRFVAEIGVILRWSDAKG
jgi:DNA polymerase I